jgi:hypothetical protein
MQFTLAWEIKTMRLLQAISLLFLVALVACRSGPEPEMVVAEGFEMFPTPRTFDAPGTLFRINREGTRLHVADWSTKVSIETSPERVPDFAHTGTRTLNVGFFLRFLKIGIKRDVKFKVDLSLEGAQREITSDSEIFDVISDMIPTVAVVEGSRYYIIRETIKVDSMRYKLSQQTLGDFGGSAAFSDSVSAAGLVWTDSLDYQIHQKFDDPHRVFFKVEELVPTDWVGRGGEALAAGDKMVLQFDLEPREEITWNKEMKEEFEE